MDILFYRGQQVPKRGEKPQYVESDPYITKPSACLTIRSLIERYARGEVGFVPQDIKEPVQMDDSVKSVRPYSSELDKQQRVDDFREDYNEKLKQYELFNEKSASNDSKGSNKPSEQVDE